MSMMRRAGLGAAFLILLALAVWPRRAEALNLCLLNCSCGISTAAVTFGSYNPLSSSNGTATGNVQVSCQLLSAGVAQIVIFNVGFSAGQGGSFTGRAMARIGGGGSLAYNLYLDAGMTTIWGDGTGGSQQASGNITVSILGAPVVSNFPIYGKLPALQQIAGGSYTDTITVTMSF
jgi:spore coat protein U-like protein